MRSGFIPKTQRFEFVHIQILGSIERSSRSLARARSDPSLGHTKGSATGRHAVAQVGFPAVGPRGTAGAAGWAPASSGGVLVSFLVRHVGGVYAL